MAILAYVLFVIMATQIYNIPASPWSSRWSLWQSWSLCSSGCYNRVQSRVRFCNASGYSPGGATTCQTGSSQICTRGCQCEAIEVQNNCRAAKMTDNSTGYMGDSCSCKNYYVCLKGAGGHWSIHGPLPCASGTHWDQAVLTCVRTTQGRQQPTPTPSTVPSIPASHKIFCIPFDKDFSTSNYAWVSHRNVVLVSGGYRGGAAKFNGNGRLEIPFFKGSLGNFPEFAVSLFYKRTDGTSGQQGLVSNGPNCPHRAVFEIRSEGTDTVGAGIRTSGGNSGIRTSGGNYLNAYRNSGASRNTWHHVVLSYNGGEVSFYVDKLKQTPRVTTSGGRLENIACPLVFGTRFSGIKAYNFTGLLDEVCIYNKDLTTEHVTALYNSYRP